MKSVDRNRTNQCYCFKSCDEYSPDFQKIVDLKYSGLVVYHHQKQIKYVNKDTESYGLPAKSSRDIFILHNPRDTMLPSQDFLSELEAYKISCPRCQKLIEHAQRLFHSKVSCIRKKDAITVCDICKLRNQPSCKECEKTVKEFFSFETTKQSARERVRIWLSKAKHLLKEFQLEEKESINVRAKALSELHIDRLCKKSPPNRRELYIEGLLDPTTSRTHRNRRVSYPLEKTIEKEECQRHEYSRFGRDDVSYNSDFDITRIGPETTKYYNDIQQRNKQKRRSLSNAPLVRFGSTEDFIDNRKSPRLNLSEKTPPLADLRGVLDENPQGKKKHFIANVSSQIARTEVRDTDQAIIESKKPIEAETIDKLATEKLTYQYEGKTSPVLRRYHSAEAITPFIGIDDELRQDFIFVFPKEKDVTKNLTRQISSSELIKDTQDMLLVQAREQEEKNEEERQRKAEAAEKKRYAREEKARQAVEGLELENKQQHLEALKVEEKEQISKDKSLKISLASSTPELQVKESKLDKARKIKNNVKNAQIDLNEDEKNKPDAVDVDKLGQDKNAKVSKEKVKPSGEKKPRKTQESLDEDKQTRKKEEKSEKKTGKSGEIVKSDEEKKSRKYEDNTKPDAKKMVTKKEQKAKVDEKVELDEGKKVRKKEETRKDEKPRKEKENSRQKEKTQDEKKLRKDRFVNDESKPTKEEMSRKENGNLRTEDLNPKKEKLIMEDRSRKREDTHIHEANGKSRSIKDENFTREGENFKTKEDMLNKDKDNGNEEQITKKQDEKGEQLDSREKEKDEKVAENNEIDIILKFEKDKNEIQKMEIEEQELKENEIKQIEEELPQLGRDKSEGAENSSDKIQSSDELLLVDKDFMKVNFKAQDDMKQKFKNLKDLENADIFDSKNIKNNDTTFKELNMKQIKIKKPSTDDLVLELVKLKTHGKLKTHEIIPKRFSKSFISPQLIRKHENHKYKTTTCPMCIDSDLELEYLKHVKKKKEIGDIIIGEEIVKNKPQLENKKLTNAPLNFESTYDNFTMAEPVKLIPALSPEEDKNKRNKSSMKHIKSVSFTIQDLMLITNDQ